MNNDDFLLDVFQLKTNDSPSMYCQDSFLAISDQEIGQAVTLSAPVSASTSVEQAFMQERQKLTVHLD